MKSKKIGCLINLRNFKRKKEDQKIQETNKIQAYHMITGPNQINDIKFKTQKGFFKKENVPSQGRLKSASEKQNQSKNVKFSSDIYFTNQDRNPKVYLKQQDLLLDQMKTNFNLVSDNNSSLRDKIEQLISENRDLSNKNEVLSLRLKVNEETRFRLEKDIMKLERNISEFQQRADENTRKEVQRKLKKKNLDFLETENGHLRNDNKKLFEMLKSTKEFKKFACFADEENALRSVKNSFECKNQKIPDWVKHFKTTQNNQKNQKLTREEHPDLFFWAPEKSFSFLRNLSKDLKVDLPEPVIDYIVLEMNSIWRNREIYIMENCATFCKNCRRNKQDPKKIVFTSDDLKLKTIRDLESQLVIVKDRLKSSQKLVERKENGLFQMHQNNVLAFNLKNINSPDLIKLKKNII